jgi:hypothetical protein
MAVGFPVYGGWIDDTERRLIWLYNPDSRTLAHEIGHAFIFSHDHSATGLMSFMTLPGMGSTQLSERDRDEMLKNKWRDFSQPLPH